MQMSFSINLTPSYFLNLFKIWEKEPSFYDKIIELDGKTLFSKEIYDKWSIIICKEDRFVFPLFYRIDDDDFMKILKEYVELNKESNHYVKIFMEKKL